jgi:hypothetical protein
MTKQVDRWIDGKRSDGLVIAEGVDGFVILPKSDGLALDRCPCCDTPLRTLRKAQLVADHVYAQTRDHDPLAA